jgi:hypothetical protein
MKMALSGWRRRRQWRQWRNSAKMAGTAYLAEHRRNSEIKAKRTIRKRKSKAAKAGSGIS